jgi:predicted neutral ceramidase superfamily lipid hydrolase
MRKKIPLRYRALIFALIMSFNTSMIVSAMIVSIHTHSYAQFIKVWPSSFVIGWPIVLAAILMIAPVVNNLLDRFIEKP